MNSTASGRAQPVESGDSILREQVASAFASIRTAALTDRGVVLGDEAQAEAVLAEASHQGRPYQALLCDFRLAGGADGLDAGRRLQSRHGPGLALLLITGETAPERLQKVRDSKVTVLFKPVSAGALMQALADCAAS